MVIRKGVKSTYNNEAKNRTQYRTFMSTSTKVHAKHMINALKLEKSLVCRENFLGENKL